MRLIQFTAPFAILALSAGAALATGPVPYTPPPPVTVYTAPAAYDWSGAYVGLQVGSMSPRGSSTAGSANDDPFDSSSGFGVFGGYQWQHGGLVFGGELGYTRFDGEFVNFPGFFIGNIAEARARVGYAFDRVLVSASLGYASQTYSGASYDLTGVTYGLGVDYAATDSVVLGLEYVVRNLDGGSVGIGDQLSVDDQSVRLRVSFHF
ncbi:outer membrane protein [Pararhodobacter zhoushanensis]|uniref:outer membrane protein n=1 Tax=Pararhodobacter zhoushanensis TaxID=2479545 RepID=UPI000F8DD573|nr:outer membrane beta-barrel protein [Pararhodobacter zhoushanensis]